MIQRIRDSYAAARTVGHARPAFGSPLAVPSHKTTATIALAVLATVFCPTVVSAQTTRISPSAVCELLPDASDAEINARRFDQSDRYCSKNYGGTGSADIRMLGSAAAALDWVRTPITGVATGISEGWRSLLGYGDYSLQQWRTPGMETIPTFNVSFSSNCFVATVRATSEGANSRLESIAQQLDRNLKGLGLVECPELAEDTPSGPLSVGLTCDPTGLDERGVSTCTASVQNSPAGAQITYEWAVDGDPRGDTSSVIQLTDLTPGSHVVSVRARDEGNAWNAGPERLTLVRGTGDLSSEDSPGGFLPRVRGPAIAVTAALVALIIIRRAMGNRSAAPPRGSAGASTSPPPGPGPGQRTGSPGRGTATPPPRTATQAPPPRPAASAAPPAAPPVRTPPPPRTAPPPRASTPPPRTPPAPRVAPPPRVVAEVQPQERKPKTEPVLSVTLVIEPSILTQNWTRQSDPAVWGNGEDFFFAGYRPTVTPASEWSIARELPADVAWSVDTGRYHHVDEFERFAGSPFAKRTDERNIVVLADWAERDGTLNLSVTVTAWVRAADGETRQLTASDRTGANSSSPCRPVPIVGAKPRAELWGQASAEPDATLTTVVGGEGTVAAYADGQWVVHVEPALFLFDQLYGGGLAITEIDDRPSGAALEDYFELTRDQFPPADALKLREGLNLRCRLNFDDEALRRVHTTGCPVAFAFRPTGDGLGADQIASAFDYLAGAHFRACALRYAAGVPAAPPVVIDLAPSTIDVSPPAPNRLPTSPKGDDRFRAKIAATVKSGSGEVVPGDAIRRDADPTRWGIRVWYAQPAEDWRRQLDRGLSQEDGLLLNASDVDAQGRLVFDAEPWLSYDHWKHFNRPVDLAATSDDVGGGRSDYLLGQTCDLQIEVVACGAQVQGAVEWTGFAGAPIHIDSVDCGYFLEVSTEDGRTDLYADGEEVLRVVARVRAKSAGADTARPTAALTFTAEGPNSDWLLLDGALAQIVDGARVIPIRAQPPTADSLAAPGAPPRVKATTVADGSELSASVTVELALYGLDVSALPDEAPVS